MDLNGSNTHTFVDLPASHNAGASQSLSPYPELHGVHPNVPPSDVQLEQTLENARPTVLNSNDPEMQLAWAADALVYVGICADHEERIAAAKPSAARAFVPPTEHQLKLDAMNIVTFLADQHHPKAEFLRGMWLEWGRFGQAEDKKEAFRCYSRAADRGYVRAEYRIGMLYESYNDPIKALRHYHRGVDAGDSASCYRLGMMTLRGQHGQPQDFPKAIELIRKSAAAADENAAQGAYVYGMLLARQLPQIEVPDGYLAYDARLARINIEKAAYLKFAKAQLKMGSAYELGSLDCDFDPALSIHYNALAAKQGEAEADMALSKWFLVGHEGVFAKNEELAFTHAERAAQSGLSTAEFALGYFNEIGMYVPVNLDKAVEWYQKASKHGNEDAKGRIEGISRKQVLNRQDHEKVAIKRITSQYGSQHGVRPERFQQRQQQVPSRLGQQSTNADEVAYNHGNGAPAYSTNGSPLPALPVQQQQPPRATSTTPYPISDRPPTVPPPDMRSAAVTPYPITNGPPQLQQRPTPRLGPAGGFFNPQQAQGQPLRPSTTLNPDVRPSSAFQFNPDIRPNSSATLPYLPSQNMRPSSAFQINPEIRSNSAMTVPQLPPQGGRPYPSQNPIARPMTAQPTTHQQPYSAADPRARLGAGQRIASGPAGLQSLPSQQQNAPRPPPQQQPQRLDIGFSAPEDARRNQSYGPSPTLRSGSVPNFDHPPANNLSAPGPGRTSAPSSRPGSTRPPTESKRPAVPVKENVAKPASAASARPAAPAVKPPGKGPKTFEEMGVPSHKQESECVSLPPSLLKCTEEVQCADRCTDDDVMMITTRRLLADTVFDFVHQHGVCGIASLRF